MVDGSEHFCWRNMVNQICVFVIIVIFKCLPCAGIFLVIPEDVPAGLAAIYGFAPIITKGNDHRIGFGFRFGNHADLQVLYEFGPQTVTKPLQASRVRSVYRTRYTRRRPVLELLFRAGILKDSGSYEYNVIHDCDDEPR